MFNQFKNAMQAQFTMMSTGSLFVVDLERDSLYETYLDSFPLGTNEIFRERTEHDCSCCKGFIRNHGHVVSIVSGSLVSIWDVAGVSETYQIVADAMSQLVKSRAIRDVYLSDSIKIGTDKNNELLVSGGTLEWSHFYHELPSQFVAPKSTIATTLGDRRTNKEVFFRGLFEISLDAAETVLELIEQNSIYRGAEHKSTVELFLKHKIIFNQIESKFYDNYCWFHSVHLRSASRIRNTVIGTLLTDISDGVPLDKAVKSFEDKVAPTNYKRPTALITQGMIDNAQETVQKLGIADSLQRRFAVAEDLTINNVLFADRSVKQSMNVFDEISNEIATDVKKFNKVDEVDIETFIKEILPKADSVSIMLENKHVENMMSLIAPEHVEAPSILKWNNNFSWVYAGSTTDSIKERVKNAGGSVDGVLRCSLSWFNKDDLDIHVIEPNGNRIFFSSPSSPSSGILDVDMNAGTRIVRDAVENITWSNIDRMMEGTYRVVINQYQKRETIDVGFDAEIEYGGVIHSFHYSQPQKDRDMVEVAKFNFSVENGIEFIESLPSTMAAKEVWGLNTQTFHKVTMVMNSPNHWDGESTGNKHYFFILEDCNSGESARGFFNEYLSSELTEHRKVFEVLGSKMKVERSDKQLSGLGFSSTQKNQIVVNVTGAFNRTIKINF